jgi:transglutaminase superfamily protein
MAQTAAPCTRQCTVATMAEETAPRRLYARALVAVALAALLLRRFGTTRTLRAMARLPLRSRRTVPDAAVIDAVRRAGGRLGADCLPQAAALAALLPGNRHDMAVILGCRRYDAGAWGAHAWVTRAGEAFDPSPAGPHTALARFEAASRWVPMPIAPQDAHR